MTTPTNVTNITNMMHSETVETVNAEYGVFKIRDTGIFYQKAGQDGETLISSPIRVTAETRNDTGNEWGRLLVWEDSDGLTHQWVIPASLLAGDGLDIIRELLDQGLRLEHNKHNGLLEYIRSVRTDNRLVCTDKVGWYGGSYVTPQRSYGPDSDGVVFQSASAYTSGFSQKGDLANWRVNVSQLAQGNSRLVFAISTAFAGTLLDHAGIDGGGFHIVGGSSSGKSTAQIIAASVWGSDSFKRSYRTTSNGLEGIALQHNHNVLILDEIKQMAPKDAGETIYMLGNGEGKTRNTKTLIVKPAKTFKVMILSSGEITLGELLAGANIEAHTGQDVRLANIKADAGQGMGVVETLHGYSSPSGLIDHMRDETRKYHGTAGEAWLNHITSDSDTLRNELPDHINQWVNRNVPANASGQVVRVARRFALVSIAGEKATQAGITGWSVGDAELAAITCFENWLSDFGGEDGENQETTKAIDSVLGFLDSQNHRFKQWYASGLASSDVVRDQVGFRKVTATHEEHYIFARSFGELCKGHAKKFAAKALFDAGYMTDQAATLVRHPIGSGSTANGRFYVIRKAITNHVLEDADVEI